MSAWVILPVVGPLIAGALLLLVERARPAWLPALGLVATGLGLALALRVLALTADGEILVYLVGNWRAPFGIALAADRLSALMLALTALVALVARAYAADEASPPGSHFDALYQFQLAGLNGAFLTADLFNLFVCFEVLLIGSYALLLHRADAGRSRAALHYVAVNLVGSAMFLVAVGLLYGVAGTLNMADLATRLPGLDPRAQPLARAAVLLLLGVFLLKAALLPLNLWMPATYAAAGAPVAALFAILTKVGVYALARVGWTVFGGPQGLFGTLTGPWLFTVALATVALGALASLGARDLRTLAAFLVIVSAGTLVAALAVGTSASLGAALFYLLHSTLAAALMFLVAGSVALRRAGAGADIEVAERPAAGPWLGALFLLAAAALVGLPPLSGFIAKLMLLEATRAAGAAAVFWTAVIGAGALALLACMRAGMGVFWSGAPNVSVPPVRAGRGERAGLSIAAAALVGLVVAAEPVRDRVASAAVQLAEPGAYARAVLEARPAPLPGRVP